MRVCVPGRHTEWPTKCFLKLTMYITYYHTFPTNWFISWNNLPTHTHRHIIFGAKAPVPPTYRFLPKRICDSDLFYKNYYFTQNYIRGGGTWRDETVKLVKLKFHFKSFVCFLRMLKSFKMYNLIKICLGTAVKLCTMQNLLAITCINVIMFYTFENMSNTLRNHWKKQKAIRML